MGQTDQRQPQTDPSRLAAIGYCFGGTTVMQLAYSGADLLGVVSFHGSLPLPDEDTLRPVQPAILICHGGRDPFVQHEHVKKFRSALTRIEADWQRIYYSGAVHSFTNRNADRHGIKGVAYNKAADKRSWRHMQVFFDAIFKPLPIETSLIGD